MAGHGNRHTTNFVTLVGVAFGNGQFVAAGNPSILLTSPDGVAYGNGVFLGVGEDGVIMQSANLGPRLSAQWLSDGGALEVLVRGGLIGPYRLQARQSFFEPWADLRSFHHTGAESRLSDPANANLLHRFYRVVGP